MTSRRTSAASNGGKRSRRLPSLFLITPLVVIFGTAALGNALFPALVNEHPLLLLALNATTRHLVATSTSVDVLPYVSVALGRRLVEDPFLYLLGRRYGDGAVEWMSRKLGAGRLLRAAQRNFRLWGSVLVFFFPGGVVCVLAGASGMPIWLFLMLNVGGTLVTIFLLRSAGEEVSGPLTWVLELMAENVVPLTILSVVLTVVVLVRRHRGAGASDREELARLEAERRGSPGQR
ncbi:MAG TPA: hypothetical protein VK988_15290 [Acidimicrobiales bacterium]|nr:hypothetical protein [Acidimicrobiales bacterium]